MVTVRRAIARPMEGRVHRGTAARLTALENMATRLCDGVVVGSGGVEKKEWPALGGSKYVERDFKAALIAAPIFQSWYVPAPSNHRHSQLPDPCLLDVNNLFSLVLSSSAFFLSGYVSYTFPYIFDTIDMIFFIFAPCVLSLASCSDSLNFLLTPDNSHRGSSTHISPSTLSQAIGHVVSRCCVPTQWRFKWMQILQIDDKGRNSCYQIPRIRRYGLKP